MSGLYKLKAYFGMVPAEYADAPDAYPVEPTDPQRANYLDDAYPPSHIQRHQSPRGRSDYRDELEHPVRNEPYRANTRRPWDEATNPVGRSNAVAKNTLSTVRQSEHNGPLGKIVTLHPRSYNEARTIGEHYRDGTPVIMNLTEMDDADAKRLVDFAAGLAFALRGSIDKVTNKVFLISPPDIRVTAEDQKRLVERGFTERD